MVPGALEELLVVEGAVVGAEDELVDVGAGADGFDSLDVGCGVVGVGVLGFEVGGVEGLDELDEEPPSPIDRIGDADEVGSDVGFAAGAADSLLTVELLDEEVGAGLNTPFTVVPSQPSGSHQGADELELGLGLGVLVGAAGLVEVLDVGAGAVGTPVGDGLAGEVVPDGALEGREDGAAGGAVVEPEDGCGAPGVFAVVPALVELELDVGPELGADVGAELGAELGAVPLMPGLACAVDPGAQFVDAAAGADEEALAAFATVGTTATPVAARKTAGSPIADTIRARLVCAASTRRAASVASSGVGTTARGLFTPPPRERSGTSSGSGSGPASRPNTPGTGAEPSRRARSRARSTASCSADLPACACPAVFSFPLLPVALKTSSPLQVCPRRGAAAG
ncbi:hypothetical protein [Catenulispora sp. GP43]|uniref:hypothetical protein n=1 Tax=Catenulispora sp. GP43 TaxID=3156263 RepID=UPI0035162E79